MSDKYTDALIYLSDAAQRHKKVYDCDEGGIAAWHESCQRTWMTLQAAWAEVARLQATAEDA